MKKTKTMYFKGEQRMNKTTPPTQHEQLFSAFADGMLRFYTLLEDNPEKFKNISAAALGGIVHAYARKYVKEHIPDEKED